MLATAFMSMWISNTASTVVMLPLLSVIQLLIAMGYLQKKNNIFRYVSCGVSTANAVGIATVIGTPPNSVLMGLLGNEYNIEISFLKWMSIGLPFSAVMITVIYFVLTRWMFPNRGIEFASSNALIAQKLNDLGPTTPEEKHVLRIFAVTVFLWRFSARSSIHFFLSWVVGCYY